MPNVVTPVAQLIVARVLRGAMPGGDPPLSTITLKSVSGHIYDSAGAVVAGATVILFRQSDSFLCARSTSGSQGQYQFPRRSDDISVYYTVAFSIAGGATQVHGVSDRGLVPV